MLSSCKLYVLTVKKCGDFDFTPIAKQWIQKRQSHYPRMSCCLVRKF